MFPSFVVWSCRCCCGSGQGPMLQWWKQKLLTVLMYWAKMPGIPVIIYINIYIYKLNNRHGYWTKKHCAKSSNPPTILKFRILFAPTGSPERRGGRVQKPSNLSPTFPASPGLSSLWRAVGAIGKKPKAPESSRLGEVIVELRVAIQLWFTLSNLAMRQACILCPRSAYIAYFWESGACKWALCRPHYDRNLTWKNYQSYQLMDWPDNPRLVSAWLPLENI